MSTVDQLRDLAAFRGVDLSGASLKADIIDRLNESGLSLSDSGDPSVGDITDLFADTSESEAESEFDAEPEEIVAATEPPEATEPTESPESTESTEPPVPTVSPEPTVSDGYFDIPFWSRFYNAGFSMSQPDVKAGAQKFGEDFDFRMPQDRSLPRAVRDLRYAETIAAIRNSTFAHEIVTKSVEYHTYALPDDVVLQSDELQNLLVAIREAQETGNPPPDYHDYL